MKNSLTRKGIAVASTFALALGAFAAISPAAADTGTVEDITDVLAEYTDTTNTREAAGNQYIREGVRTGTLTAQLVDGVDDLDLSGIRVRATFGEDAGGYGFDSEDIVFSVAGAEDTINDADGAEDNIYAYGVTNASGQVVFNFSVNGEGAVDDDYVYAEIDYYTNFGWSGDASAYFEWETAEVDSFDVNDDATSGNTVSLTYTAKDQFGGGISRVDSSSDDILRVTFMSCDGLADKVTKSLVNGSATFSYTQPSEIELGEYSTVEGELHHAGAANTPSDCDDDQFINEDSTWNNASDENFEAQTDVYRNAPTVSVDTDDDQYVTLVTYGGFKDGNYDADEDFAAWVEDYGIYSSGNEDYVNVSIYVETEHEDVSYDAAYQAVTVSGSGLYFMGYDSNGEWVMKSGSITLETDSSGLTDFDVASHKESLNGQSITITSGGKSKTVKLNVYMNPTIDENTYYLGNGGEPGSGVDAAVLTWSAKKIGGGLTGPAFASNTAYTVKVTAKDVWGNVLRGAEVSIDADRASEMDPFEDAPLKIWGLDSAAEDNIGVKTVGSNGKGTFFVRATNFEYPNRKAYFNMTAEIVDWDYESGLDVITYDFSAEPGSGKHEREVEGWTGAQAQAKAGVKKGAVRVGAYNVNGKTVKVYVGGKLVKTATASKAKYVTRVTGIKAGDKRVTVWVGGKRMLSTVVTVK